MSYHAWPMEDQWSSIAFLEKNFFNMLPNQKKFFFLKSEGKKISVREKKMVRCSSLKNISGFRDFIFSLSSLKNLAEKRKINHLFLFLHVYFAKSPWKILFLFLALWRTNGPP